MKSLGDLRIGDRAVVRQVHGADELSIRLMEMGLTPGTAIVAVGRAPLGDPLEFEVRGYRLSVRRAEADRVEIDGESQ